MKISFSFSAVIWHKFGRGVGLRLKEYKKQQWVFTGYMCSIILYASQQLSCCLTATLWILIESGDPITSLEAVGRICSACTGNQIPIPRSPSP